MWLLSKRSLIAGFLLSIFLLIFIDLKNKSFSYFPALVLPHNPLFSQRIDKILLSFLRKIDKVIIFGPNHKDIGPHIITNQNSIGEKMGIQVDEDLIENEHSIKVLEQVIKIHFPKAKIIPFVFRRGLDLDKILSFSKELKAVVNSFGRTLLIASVDFSHYLNEAEAQRNDQETLEIIKRRDYYHLNQLGSEHLDCASCLIVILELTKGKEPVVLDHIYKSGTSYFFVNF